MNALIKYCQQHQPALSARPLRQTVFVGADYESLLEKLFAYFESAHNLRETIETSAGISGVSRRQLTDIVACLRQGRELLQSARAAGTLARPIVAFYAVHSLAKAVALSYGHPRKIESFPAKHGLSSLKQYAPPFESISATVEADGLFHRFVDAIAEGACFVTHFMHPSEGDDVVFAARPSPSSELIGLEFSLRELLGRILGLEQLFYVVFKEPAKIASIQSLASLDRGEVHLQVMIDAPGTKVASDPTELTKIHQPLSQGYPLTSGKSETNVNVMSHGLPVGGPASLFAGFETLIFPVSRGPGGQRFALHRFQERTLLEPSVMYMASHLLSNLARYRPDVWTAVNTPGVTDREDIEPGLNRFRPVLDHFLDLLLDRFALGALSAISRTELAISERSATHA